MGRAAAQKTHHQKGYNSQGKQQGVTVALIINNDQLNQVEISTWPKVGTSDHKLVGAAKAVGTLSETRIVVEQRQPRVCVQEELLEPNNHRWILALVGSDIFFCLIFLSKHSPVLAQGEAGYRFTSREDVYRRRVTGTQPIIVAYWHRVKRAIASAAARMYIRSNARPLNAIGVVRPGYKKAFVRVVGCEVRPL